MNLSKIHHIAIIVSDYEAAKDFYVNKLGFSVIRENYRSERRDWKLDLRVNELTELEIFAEETFLWSSYRAVTMCNGICKYSI